MLQDLKRNLQIAETKLEDLKRDLVAAIPKASSPDDPNLNRIEKEIDDQTGRVRRLKSMIEAGKEAESQASVEARNTKTKANAEKTKKIGSDRVKLAGEIDKTIATLGTLLGQWRELGQVCASAAGQVHTLDGMAWQYSLMNAARGDNSLLAGALDHALFKAGVGSVGIYSDSCNIRKPLGEFYTLADAAENVAGKLAAQIDNSLRQVLEG